MASTFGPQEESRVCKEPTTAFMAGRKPLNVLIAGGSHSGLFIGILLKRLGHNVRVLERSTESARSGLAAGIGLGGWVKRFFDENDRLKHMPLGVPNEVLEVLDLGMNTIRKMPLNYRMTTWDATYYRLRANFDGTTSTYCPNAPSMEPGEGEGVTETGRNVLRVEEGENGLMRVVAEDVVTKQQQTYDADVVIGADGANSTLRRQLHPDLQRQEPGYVLWRGTIPTSQLSKEALDRFDERTTQCPMEHSYTIVYSIPGEDGKLEPGDRHINFAWYTWPSSSNLTTAAILTDKDNNQHRTSLPKGSMRAEIWARQLSHAKTSLPPLLYELASKITAPLVTLVSTVCAPQAAHFHDRVFLVGDALCQLQPNTGQGTNFAAMDAMMLAQVFAGEMGPGEWNRRVVEASLKEQARAVSFASSFLGKGTGGSHVTDSGGDGRL